MHLKYDSMHTNRIFNALNCINNHVNLCKNCMLSRCNGGTKPIEIDANIELHAVSLQCHKIYGGRLIKVNLLNQGLQAIEMGLKREISVLEGEKRLKDLYHTTDVCVIPIDCLKGLPKKVCMLDVHERLGNALLDDIKHPSDNGWVGLQPRGIRWVSKWQRVVHEIIMKVVRLKKELKARSPCCITMICKILGMSSKLWCDWKMRSNF